MPWKLEEGNQFLVRCCKRHPAPVWIQTRRCLSLHDLNRLRRFVSILLLVLLAYQGLGYWLVQQWYLADWQQARLEELARTGLQDDERTTLSLQDFSEVVWESEAEFMYRGQMYECIAAKISTDGHYELQCIADHEETALRDRYADFVGEAGDEEDAPVEDALDTKKPSEYIEHELTLPIGGVEKSVLPLARHWSTPVAPLIDDGEQPPCLS